MTDRRDDDIERQLAPENDWIVDLAIDYAERRLPPSKMEDVRNRLASDPDFRAVAQPVLDAMAAPPLSRAELERYWRNFTQRVGLETESGAVQSAPDDLSEYRDRVRRRSGKWWRRAKIAVAIFVGVITLPLLGLNLLSRAYFTTMNTPANGQTTLSLADSVTAVLAPSSSLKYHKRFGESRFRWITLNRGMVELDFSRVRGTPYVVWTPHAWIQVNGARLALTVEGDQTRLVVRQDSVLVRWVGSSSNPEGERHAVPAGKAARIRRLSDPLAQEMEFRTNADTTLSPWPPRRTP